MQHGRDPMDLPSKPIAMCTEGAAKLELLSGEDAPMGHALEVRCSGALVWHAALHRPAAAAVRLAAARLGVGTS